MMGVMMLTVIILGAGVVATEDGRVARLFWGLLATAELVMTYFMFVE